MQLVAKVQRLQRQAAKLRPPTSPTEKAKTPPLQQFIPQTTPQFNSPAHLEIVTKQLERTLTEPVFMVFSLPPRHFKTETTLHYIAWVLAQHQDWTVVYSSYAQQFAESKSLKAQRYALNAGVTPDVKMQNRAEWRTAAGGGILTTGIGGPLTGQGANILIIDDPVKNREEADSPTIREKHWAWFEDVAETRLEPGASVIVLMTRWHEDDLAGRIAKNRPEYEIVRIPALADGLDGQGKHAGPDPLGRAEGTALLPERVNAAQLEEIKAKKPYTFASLYQGLPRPREGRLFGEPTFYTGIPNGVSYAIGVDLAYTAKSRADHSAAVVFAKTGDKHYIKHVERWQADINGSITRLKRLQATYPGPLTVEANGPQKAVADTLQANGISLNRVNPVADKYSRAQPFAEAWNAGRVLVPDPNLELPWLGNYLEEISNFTGANDPEDDQVDASGNGFEDTTLDMFVF